MDDLRKELNTLARVWRNIDTLSPVSVKYLRDRLSEVFDEDGTRKVSEPTPKK